MPAGSAGRRCRSRWCHRGVGGRGNLAGPVIGIVDAAIGIGEGLDSSLAIIGPGIADQRCVVGPAVHQAEQSPGRVIGIIAVGDLGDRAGGAGAGDLAGAAALVVGDLHVLGSDAGVALAEVY